MNTRGIFAQDPMFFGVDVCVPIAVGFQNFWTGAEVIVTGAAM
jgi:hypothetical protein